MSLVRLTCRQAARLLMQRQHRMLGVTERVRLRLHLGICEMCTRFSGQLRLMDRAMARWRAYRDTGDGAPPARQRGDDREPFED